MFILSSGLYADDNEEFRATWVITYEIMDSTASTEANMAHTRQILDNHLKANMNAVLWQCRQNGTAYYNSLYEPWGKYTGYQDPGYDPLAYAVEQAHQRGLEIHAWMNVFESRDRVSGSPAREHPEWICRDRDGITMTSTYWLSPGLSDVREYLLKIAMEIVRNYDIDGLHLDFIRWSETTNTQNAASQSKKNVKDHALDGMITEEQVNEMLSNPAGRYLYDIEHPYSNGIPDGFETWEDWWRWSVTEFVRTLHDSIQAVKPWVRLSPAALGKYNWSGWQGYDIVYQDAALWFNEGYIDQLTPMHYHWLTGIEFYNMLTGGCPDCWRQYIQPGINAGRLFTVGPPSYKLNEENRMYRHSQIVESSRDVSWVDGFQFFSNGDWEEREYWDEGRASFFQQKSKIRATGLIDDTAPEAPTIDLIKLDSLNYQVDVTPAASVSGDHWFLIYRSEDQARNVDRDEIINIRFGSNAYSFLDSFSGNQDYNETYHYFATTLDRFWNESNVSNTIESDPVFSAAPVVSATDPAEGDTIQVHVSLTIDFSKSMDQPSVEAAIQLDPDPGALELIWLTEQKSLSIQPENQFNFATDYTLTIDPSALDVNGKNLDGNGDGFAGDAFVLNFRTGAQDETGPAIIATFPDAQAQEANFAVDDVISFVFDEIVDDASLHDSTMVLSEGADQIEIGFKNTVLDAMSVLSIQPMDPLMSDTEYSIQIKDHVTDTLGNTLERGLSYTFRTLAEEYVESSLIDKFLSTSNWAAPGYSGSTIGIYAPNTSFGMSTNAYLPSSSVRQRVSAALEYEWDESATKFLIREFCSGTAAQGVEFDTTVTLQVHMFGDGSNNKFRFCVDEGNTAGWNDHEVSQWITIDWYGWRLLEWDMGDPEATGYWEADLGNQKLDGTRYRIDSIQLTHESGAKTKSTVYFDNLRIVKKAPKFIDISEADPIVAQHFDLLQNYPNPFNPVTTIPFSLEQSRHITLKVYNVLGRQVATLINATMPAGTHSIEFDGSGLTSGFYFYILNSNGRTLKKRMILMK
jgi:uncharacterized lipoprotein YddW (UPF0748 family)